MEQTLVEFFQQIDTPKNQDAFYFSTHPGGKLKENPHYYGAFMEKFAFHTECFMNWSDHEQQDQEKFGTKKIDISDFLIYSEIGHTPSYYVAKVGSMEEAIAFIRSDGGLCNPYISNMILLHQGRVLPYQVKNPNGELMRYQDIDFQTTTEDIGIIEWLEN